MLAAVPSPKPDTPTRPLPQSFVPRSTVAALALAAACCCAGIAPAEPLPSIGPAPAFSLTTQDGRPLALRDLHGRPVALTFLFTQCSATCPVLMAKLVDAQRRLVRAGGNDVHFVGITLTPVHDSPRELKRYADAHGADAAHWSLLTGDDDQIAALAREYGVWQKKNAEAGDLDHAFVTSLIDRRGTLRVQYIGTRFSNDEFLADLRLLAAEPTGR